MAMQLNFENNIRETTVQEVSLTVSGIPAAFTRLEFSGDMYYIIGTFPSVDGFLAKVTGSSWTGKIVLAEGDGDKVIRARGYCDAGTVFTNGTVTIVGPTGFIQPGTDGVYQKDLIGKGIFVKNPLFPAPGEPEYVEGNVYDVQGGFILFNVVIPPIGVMPNPVEYYFDASFYGEEYASNDLKLITEAPVAVECPDAAIDVTGYWEWIRTVWAELSYDDKQLVEKFWEGMTEEDANLLQRMYEIEASENIRDIITFRRQSWVGIDCHYRKYKGTGSTDRTTPNHFFDKTNKPFRQKNEFNEFSDEGLYITIAGKSYKIGDVISSWEVSLDGANFDTALSLDYELGGQVREDLTSKYDISKSTTKTLLMSKENWKDLEIQDLFNVTTPNLVDGGRYRVSLATISIEVKIANLDRVYYDKPIFNVGYKGATFSFNGSNYRVLDYDPDGYYVVLDSNAVAGLYEAKVTPSDYSTYSQGSVIAGDTITELSGEHPFYAADLGRKITLQGTLNSGIFKIVQIVDPDTVRVDGILLPEANVPILIPVDYIVNLEDGLVRRVETGNLVDVSYVDFECHVKVEYRIPISNNVSEIPTLQEILRCPGDSASDIKVLIARDEIFIGHQNILTETLTSKRGVSLTHGTDYTIDRETGVITLLSSLIGAGESFQAEMTYVPHFGEEDNNHFIDEPGWIYFREMQRVPLWADVVYFDEEDPYHKFGSLINFYQKNSEIYYLSMLALWITYWTGPRPDYIERGVNILMGLPFAKASGLVLSTALRRIGLEDIWAVSLLYSNGESETVELPGQLQPHVFPGEQFDQFDILSGLQDTFYHSGDTLDADYRRTVVDSKNAPFVPSMVGGKIFIEGGANRGIYNVVSVIDSERITIDADLLQDAPGDLFTYTITTSAVRIFDQTNYDNFLDELGNNAIGKYLTQNTTPAEIELAKSLLRRHLFICQAEPPAFINRPDFQTIFDFLRQIKPEYTDFIFQILVSAEDEFEIGETGFGYDIILDLTSTFLWWSGHYRQAADPFTGLMLNSTYPSYKDGLLIGVPTNLLNDTVNAPFTPDDVGKYIWFGSAWRHYKGGGTSVNSNLFQASPGVFNPSAVGDYLHLPNYGGKELTVKIIQYVSPTTVVVDHYFDQLLTGLEFHINWEFQQGVYRITGYNSPTQVVLDTWLSPASGVLYAIINEPWLLGEEAIGLYAEGVVELYDAGMVLLETIPI